MKRAEGTRNLSELSEAEKDKIVEKYFECDMRIVDMAKFFKVTVRTVPALLKERGINTARKNRYTLNEHYFDKVDTERKAYWLGYLFADGFVGDENFNNIVFSQKQSDGYIVKEFAKDIEFTGKTRLSKRTGGFENGEKSVILNFSSRTMTKALGKLKMYTCKSMTMEELPPIKSDLMRHFVRGYFDGDGSVSMCFKYVNRKGRTIYSRHCDMIGTQPFLEKIARLVPAESFLSDSRTPEMKYLNFNKISSMIPLYHYMYDGATVYLKRKFNVWNDIMGDLTQKENGINSDEEVSAA